MYLCPPLSLTKNSNCGFADRMMSLLWNQMLLSRVDTVELEPMNQ